MADWGNIYEFDPEQDVNIRLRRLERGRQTLRGGSLVSPSSNYAAVPTQILDGNSITLISPSIVGAGSISATGFKGKFTFSADASSITVYWDGTNSSEKFYRLGDDGSVTTVGGSSMTVTGLAASTPYGFLPFYSPNNTCGVGWVQGDSGSPKFAFTAAAQTVLAKQRQVLRNREPITTDFITYSTTSGGTTTGGGGGGRTCVMLGTDIEPLGDIPYSTKHHRCNEWWHIQARHYPRSLNCTHDHPLFHSEKGKMEANHFKVRGGDLHDWIITDQGEYIVDESYGFRRVCTKVQVHMPYGHLFWANGYLSHNLKPYDTL